jgi:hypothetical protein
MSDKLELEGTLEICEVDCGYLPFDIVIDDDNLGVLIAKWKNVYGSQAFCLGDEECSVLGKVKITIESLET